MINQDAKLVTANMETKKKEKQEAKEIYLTKKKGLLFIFFFN